MKVVIFFQISKFVESSLSDVLKRNRLLPPSAYDDQENQTPTFGSYLIKYAKIVYRNHLNTKQLKSKHFTFQTLFCPFSNGLITGLGRPFEYLMIMIPYDTDSASKLILADNLSISETQVEWI